jgi:hypothetical protein
VVCTAGVPGDAMVCDPWIVGAWPLATQRADRGCRSDLGCVGVVHLKVRVSSRIRRSATRKRWDAAFVVHAGRRTGGSTSGGLDELGNARDLNRVSE